MNFQKSYIFPKSWKIFYKVAIFPKEIYFEIFAYLENFLPLI